MNADAMSCLHLPEKPDNIQIPKELILIMEILKTIPISAPDIKEWKRKVPLLLKVCNYVQT